MSDEQCFPRDNDWFLRLFGFEEKDSNNADIVRQSMTNDDEKQLISLKNGRTFQIGTFSTPTLKELRQKYSLLRNNANNSKKESSQPKEAQHSYFGAILNHLLFNNKNPQQKHRNTQLNKLKITHKSVNDIYETHQEREYHGALFQVASQFNCLEFVSSSVIPEEGITGYLYDRTQGPACSLACAPATLFRNYFVKTPKGNIGQSEFDQLNNLDNMEDYLSKENLSFWEVKGGYVFANKKNLEELEAHLESFKNAASDLLSELKIGLQIETEVVDLWNIISSRSDDFKQLVSQAFCSAVSISYSGLELIDWRTLALIILHGAYEATILAGAINLYEKRGSNIVVLSLIGGGVFGNSMEWIAESIGRACALLDDFPLDIRIAHYKYIDQSVVRKIEHYYSKYLQEFSQNPSSKEKFITYQREIPCPKLSDLFL